MSKYQQRSVYIALVVLIFFLVLSFITHNWGFVLWSLIPVFLVFMLAFAPKTDKENNGK